MGITDMQTTMGGLTIKAPASEEAADIELKYLWSDESSIGKALKAWALILAQGEVHYFFHQCTFPAKIGIPNEQYIGGARPTSRSRSAPQEYKYYGVGDIVLVPKELEDEGENDATHYYALVVGMSYVIAATDTSVQKDAADKCQALMANTDMLTLYLSAPRLQYKCAEIVGHENSTLTSLHKAVRFYSTNHDHVHQLTYLCPIADRLDKSRHCGDHMLRWLSDSRDRSFTG
jgi:hypothetical protein